LPQLFYGKERESKHQLEGKGEKKVHYILIKEGREKKGKRRESILTSQHARAGSLSCGGGPNLFTGKKKKRGKKPPDRKKGEKATPRVLGNNFFSTKERGRRPPEKKEKENHPLAILFKKRGIFLLIPPRALSPRLLRRKKETI